MDFINLKFEDISIKDKKCLLRMRSKYDKIMTDYLRDSRRDVFYYICKGNFDKILGWATLEPYSDHGYYNVYVKPANRKRGIATSLFEDMACQYAGDIFVRSPDDKSRDFFLKMSRKFSINIKFLE